MQNIVFKHSNFSIELKQNGSWIHLCDLDSIFYQPNELARRIENSFIPIVYLKCKNLEEAAGETLKKSIVMGGREICRILKDGNVYDEFPQLKSPIPVQDVYLSLARKDAVSQSQKNKVETKYMWVISTLQSTITD